MLEIASKGEYNIAVVNVLPLVCALCLYWFLRKESLGKIKALPFYLLLGTYLFCPLASTIAASASGGGFNQPFGPREALMLLLFSVVPIFAMMCAVYNGTLGALFAITIIFIIEGCRRMWPGAVAREKLT